MQPVLAWKVKKVPGSAFGLTLPLLRDLSFVVFLG